MMSSAVWIGKPKAGPRSLALRPANGPGMNVVVNNTVFGSWLAWVCE